MDAIQQIRKQQTLLAYHNVLTWLESEHIAVLEREAGYYNLLEIKQKEQEEIDKAKKKKYK